MADDRVEPAGQQVGLGHERISLRPSLQILHGAVDQRCCRDPNRPCRRLPRHPIGSQPVQYFTQVAKRFLYKRRRKTTETLSQDNEEVIGVVPFDKERSLLSTQ